MPARRASRRSKIEEKTIPTGKEHIHKMEKLAKILLAIIKALLIVVCVLFVVYFWNLDQKLMGWAYKQVNTMFDRKKVDLVF